MKPFALVLFVLALVGCEATGVLKGPTRIARTAGENWKLYCASCHGADGKGETDEGKRVRVKDFTDSKVQGELRYMDMVRAIVDGVYDTDRNERMGHFGDKLFATEVNELVTYIRNLKK